jgi:SpoVK/Ycf46/Vps4 family AAA+-type ATPase
LAAAGAGEEAATGVDGPTLWRACRRLAGAEMEDLAQRIVPVAGWEDIVLPPQVAARLREIAAQVEQRARVYGEWGFGPRLNRGRGIAALFAGPSGTGKTMAAEVLARHLGLDLYRIDLAGVVSKYIGETERNLRRVFDAAEAGGALLFFDEADALFGRRTEVKDSHDRYANVEIDYLLQRMEEYRGLAILASNRKSALDRAFLRRLRFVVELPFPDAAARRRIWRLAFPPQTPLARLDWDALSRLELAGGNIRNVSLNAAFRAADAGDAVSMSHLAAAVRAEYAKCEKAMSQVEMTALAAAEEATA